MIDELRSAAASRHSAIVRSLETQKRFLRIIWSLLVAMQHGKPNTAEAAQVRKRLEEHLASQRSSPGVLQKWLQKTRRRLC